MIRGGVLVSKLQVYENLNISITANIKDLLVPLIQQIREIRDFLNLRTKCMDPKPNFNNDLTDIICEKDLIVENEILKVKLEEADKENTFLRGEVKDLTVLLNAKIQTSSHNFKRISNAYSKKTLIHKYNHNLAFKLILPKVICYTIKTTFQIKEIL